MKKILHSVPSQDSYTFNKNGINEKVHLLLVFVLLTLAAWILERILHVGSASLSIGSISRLQSWMWEAY